MSFLDRVTLGPARRRRRLLRRMRALDREIARERGREHHRDHEVAAAHRRRVPARRARGVVRELVHTLVVVTVTVVLTATAIAFLSPHLVPEPIAGALGLRPAPLGQAPEVSGTGSHTFLQRQRTDPEAPVAYDPCREIHVEINPDQGPDDAVEMVQEAMTTVGEATGLQFVYDGTTDDRPHWSGPTRPFGLGRQDPVLVSFATSEEVSELKGRIAGIGGSASVTDERGHARYVTGQVTLDADSFDSLLDQSGGEERARAIVLHELGHLVGLGHVEDESELMHARNTGRTDFGPGDRIGLAELGQGRCF